MSTRDQEAIHEKGFDMNPARAAQNYESVDFSKIRIGLQSLEDAILDLGNFSKNNPMYGNKNVILKALAEKNYPLLREISNYFFEMSGIYERICKYFAFLYRYDWYVVPYIDDTSIKEDKILSELARVLRYLDNSNIKKLCGDIALKVIINGCYYGYITDNDNGLTVQELPVEYCRSRYMIGQRPVVEFNMAFFDEYFSDVQYRMRVLNLFPEEFKKGYLLYKQNKLVDTDGVNTRLQYPNNGRQRSAGWYLLDTENAFKLNLNGVDYPVFVNAIPSIIDLDSAQEMDRRKTMQKLLKILIQKLPLDKNSDLVFDVDEAKDIHNNAVAMLKRAIGVDVMTTFADVQVADLADKTTATTTDDLEKIERTLYNALGVSENLFNTDGNIALEKSILNDEASMRNLILQFSELLNHIIARKFPDKKRYSFRAIFLETTIYNYQDLAKMYKEQVQLGYSKMLPQIALGHSQSAILAMAHFENNIMRLYEVMIPPLMSSTMSSEQILGKKGGQFNTEESTGGRPEKPDSEKSEKTIQNRESMS